MNKLKNLNIAGKITDGFKNFNAQKMNAFFTYLVIVLVIIACLVGVYFYLLEQNMLDVVYHEDSVVLSSNSNKNIAASNLPVPSSYAFTLNAWFAVDKSQYINKKKTPYSHLISYGRIRRKREKSDPFSIGAWINNKTNNILIVYKTEADDENTYYDPNSESFNSKNTYVIKNYLLNEWNLLSLSASANNLMIYLNGQLYETKVNKGNLYYRVNKPLFNIEIGKKKNINGIMKSVRFRDYAYQAYEIADLYFAGPNKFIVPDVRKKIYLGEQEITFHRDVGSKSTAFLNSGANLIDDALVGMNDFFKQF